MLHTPTGLVAQLAPHCGQVPIGRYRDRRLIWHNGGIDGFLTQCMLLPDDEIGVTVMTNTSSSGIDLIVACLVLDEPLGIEPSDLFSVLKPRFDAVMTEAREAKAARRIVSGAPPGRPLPAYPLTMSYQSDITFIR